MKNVVLLKDILKDNQYPEAGVLLFKIAKEAIDNGETLILNMCEVESVPTVFMNTSFGELIASYGVEKTKKVFLFKSITKAQVQRIRKYFADYENIVMKKLYITFCLLLVSLCIHAQMISGIIVDEKNSR